MRKTGFVLFLGAVSLLGEVHTLTLGEAVDRALAANPELTIARLDEQTAAEQVQVARDPFFPKVFVGSGLAYTSGFPLSVEGAAPSIVQAQGIASIINRPLRHQLAQAREEVTGAALDTRARREEIGLRTAELFLDAEYAARSTEALRAQVISLERVAEAVRARVDEGQDLPIEVKRAELDLARARQRVEAYETAQAQAESALAAVLGYGQGDKVRAAAAERPTVDIPESEDAAVAEALGDNPELLRLQSSLAASRLQVKAENAAKLPRVNLVAQYAVLSRFNNYDRFFNDFQRHNGQVGVSVEVPLYAGPAVKARTAQANADVMRLEARITSSQTQIALDARRDYQEVRKAQTAAEVVKLDLDLARENLGVVLARMEEGRASLRDVEAARYLENEKWIAFYDSQHALELARYRLLDRTGGLLAALR